MSIKRAKPTADEDPLTSPEAGNHPNQLEKTLINSAAKKKEGKEIPIMVTTVTE
jgi:hypothetical protein